MIFTAYFLFTRINFVLYYPSNFATINMIIVGIFIVFLGWLLVACGVYKAKMNRKLIRTLENSFMFCCTMSFCLSALFKAYNGQCTSTNYHLQYGCDTSFRQISEGSQATSLFTPFALQFVLKSCTWSTQLKSFVCAVACNLFCIQYFELSDSYCFFVFSVVFNLVILCASRLQSVSMFLLYEGQLRLVDDNKLLAKADRVSDMRHLVANMAHDLKTVSDMCLFYNCCD